MMTLASIFVSCSAEESPYVNTLKWSEREGIYEGAYMFDAATSEVRGLSVTFKNDGTAEFYYWTSAGVMQDFAYLTILPLSDNNTTKLAVTFKTDISRPPFRITALSDTEASIREVYTSDNNSTTVTLTKQKK